ncbi:MAG: transcription-repair coupling factor [Verrucomicrobiae bacterium]|nr:transcription-repair coupling factor [Verrucomicrobiae bacterium]
MSSGETTNEDGNLPDVLDAFSALEAGGCLSFGGVAVAAQPYLTERISARRGAGPLLIVTPNLKAQERFQQDFTTWTRQTKKAGTDAEAALFFPAWEILPHQDKLPHADVISERLESLVALLERKPKDPLVIVASVEAVVQRTFPPEALRGRLRRLRCGDTIDPLDLVEWLEEQGYDSEVQVNQKSEIAMRGGIVDVYPPTSPWPVRLEFFGDELESLRYFDPVSQVSREPVDSVLLSPAGELGLLKRTTSEADLGLLTDYLPPDTSVILSEAETIEEHATAYLADLPEDERFHETPNSMRDLFSSRGFSVVEMREETTGTIPVDGLMSPTFQSLEDFRPLGDRAPDPQIADAQKREFFGQMHRWLRQGYDVRVFCNNSGEQQRFKEIWSELGFKAGRVGPKCFIGSLSRGFLFAAGKLVVITDAEIFGRYRVQRSRRLKAKHASATRSAMDIDFTELEFGDLVVHLQHGIGRYCGLTNLAVGGRRREDEHEAQTQECMVIEYAARDSDQTAPKLYVPVTEAHLVSKYVGTGKIRPPLHVLGGSRWGKAKEQAERAVRDLASDLLSIQAKREAEEGHAFGADTSWQQEFESSFLFEETPDQLQAIEAAKKDLESTRPMDRLVCGDVGFGKTEVAIRAAFKAVMAGKQVAFLVPTTVLAQQHYNTLRDRMADYPVRVELLSRFRTPKQQRQVVDDLANGGVDIVVGTHRLVQKDVIFKDLGLVVIDEEQRFGVMHKEKFKRMRAHVDVLTLSATPIPRTLYLALTGARDMSTIQTPPQDRLPVETTVCQYDERVIKDAIRRELNRGGQVFFLHNRVTTIEHMRGRIQQIVPDARVVVGHGQMDADELEEVMTKFVNGDADVLLSTTIIESGLDIPNANTIIIDRADRFGLSQLYQLRGRVGRYKNQAFAYLLLPRHARLLTDVRKRMSAIKQYAQLGSGFKIAMRDLEIRGAGNLLGAQQSGHITAVGFDLYCQLLKQSVSALKGEKVKPRVNTQVMFDFLAIGFDGAGESGDKAGPPNVGPEMANIPFGYVTEPEQRIQIYRKVSQASEKDDLVALENELRDRFGPIPDAVRLLLLAAEVKQLGTTRGVTQIETRGPKLMLTRQGDYLQLGGKFPRLSKKTASAKLKEIKKLLLAIGP